MIGRCHTKSTSHYHRYGGRGIKVCKRWLKFENFLEDMGHPTKEQTIDRIDNNGDYSPKNCRWATRFEQSYNRSTNVRIEFNGSTKTLTEWAQDIGVTSTTLDKRIKKWGIAHALSTGIKERYSVFCKWGHKREDKNKTCSKCQLAWNKRHGIRQLARTSEQSKIKLIKKINDKLWESRISVWGK